MKIAQHDEIRHEEKKTEQKVDSLRDRIDEHRDKIAAERSKSYPDEGCILHWEKEIKVFEKQIDKVMRRLEG